MLIARSTILVLIYLVFYQASCFAQSHDKADSIQKKLANYGSSDTARVSYLIELSEIYLRSIPEKSLQYATEAYEIVEHSTDYEKKVATTNAQGVAYEYLGKFEIAIQKYDEARKISKGADYESGLVKAYGNLAISYERLSIFDSAMIFYQKALTLAVELGEKMEIADNYFNLGNLYATRGDYDNAMTYYKSAMNGYNEISSEESVCLTYLEIGNIHQKKGHFPTALDYYMRGFKIAERIGDEKYLARCNNSIGQLYFDQKDWSKALKHFNRALNVMIEYGQTYSLPPIYKNIGAVLIEKKQYDQALKTLRRGYEISTKNRTNIESSTLLYYIGFAYQKKNDFSRAEGYYKQAFEMKEEVEDKFGMIELLLRLGEIYEIKGKSNDAIEAMKKAYLTSQELNAEDGMKKASEDLSSIYRNMGDYEKAFLYQSEVLQLNEKLFGVNKSREIAKIEMRNQNAYKQVELARLQKEKVLSENRIRQQQIFFGILSALVVGLVFLLFSIKKKSSVINKANSLLEAQKLEIEKQHAEIFIQQEEILNQRDLLQERYETLKELDAEKNYLISVVAHDLKTPLNQIKGFLTILNFEAEGHSDTTKAMHKMISQTIDGMSGMISKILDLDAIESKSLNMKVEDFEIDGLLSEIIAKFELMASNKKINIVLNSFTSDSLVSLDKNLTEQIFENLISNSLKFSPLGTQITVSTSRIDNNIRVAIMDEGPGIDESEQKHLFKKFQKLSAKPTGMESSTGLGLSIVKKYVESMSGEVWYEDAKSGGAKFLVEFKLDELKV
jgi:signal transduction histidine kinase/Tfp pilus assembly protein PilF